MSTYVVDASVAAKWVLDEPHAAAARRMLRKGNHLHAPDLFLLETDNLLCKRVRRRELHPDDAEEARRLLAQVPVQYHPFHLVRAPAYQIARRTRRSVYDSLYVALAVLLEAPMVTADRRLYNGLAGTVSRQHIVWVEDVPEEEGG